MFSNITFDISALTFSSSNGEAISAVCITRFNILIGLSFIISILEISCKWRRKEIIRASKYASSSFKYLRFFKKSFDFIPVNVDDAKNLRDNCILSPKKDSGTISITFALLDLSFCDTVIKNSGIIDIERT